MASWILCRYKAASTGNMERALRHSKAAAPISPQVQDVRYNIKFTANYTEVAYSYYQFQTFHAAASCTKCSLSDQFVGINRCAAAASAGGSACTASHTEGACSVGKALSKLENDRWQVPLSLACVVLLQGISECAGVIGGDGVPVSAAAGAGVTGWHHHQHRRSLHSGQ